MFVRPVAAKLGDSDKVDTGDVRLIVGWREGECHPDVHNYLLKDSDQLLLCTRSLTDTVAERDIEIALNNATSANSACRSLIDLSLGNGGLDNVTVIVARYSIPGGLSRKRCVS